MARPACPLCGSEDNEKRFADKGYDVVQCNGCELFFIDPYPSDFDKQHDRVREDDYDDLKILDSQRAYRAEVQFYKRHFPAIERQCANASSVLDVGCGTGRLLGLLGDRHPEMRRVGIELNADRAAMAREKAGCEIHQVPVEDFSGEAKFDVITMINVLSHIPSFDGLFAAFRSLLSENGKLILAVGEMEKDVRKNDIFDWGIPDHLHFLGMKTMDFIANKYGFEIVEHSRVPYSQKLFSRTRWKAPGRSAFRNAVKQIVVHVPFALSALAMWYDRKHGKRIVSSFIVLKAAP